MHYVDMMMHYLSSKENLEKQQANVENSKTVCKCKPTSGIKS